MLQVHLIAAARPNFMKVAPLYHALAATDWAQPRIVHTGQHYDPNMSDAFFRDLGMPKPHFHLEVGSGSHAEQLGGVMIAYEKVALAEKPDWIIVVGDVNSTAACALVGTKLGIPVVHLEAGLRSGDRRMPEEINRLVTDAICDVYWTPSPDADAHLAREGVDAAKVDFVGNIMIDSYEMMREAIEADTTRSAMGLAEVPYGVVTLHRPSNVDTEAALRPLVSQLVAVSARLRLVFAVHPRTRKRLQDFGLMAALEGAAGITLTEPLGYLQFMNLVTGSSAVVTDSGGVQEETTYLGIPCLTLRENTERPVTVTEGTNRLVKLEELAARLDDVIAGRWPRGQRPALWYGQAARRCVEHLRRRAGLAG
ncbi:MAG: non-hydrolyzing UDP-N-acetylglucosamine 2-epimerase [Gammaproteobacteria bacterium]